MRHLKECLLQESTTKKFFLIEGSIEGSKEEIDSYKNQLKKIKGLVRLVVDEDNVKLWDCDVVFLIAVKNTQGNIKSVMDALFELDNAFYIKKWNYNDYLEIGRNWVHLGQERFTPGNSKDKETLINLIKQNYNEYIETLK